MDGFAEAYLGLFVFHVLPILYCSVYVHQYTVYTLLISHIQTLEPHQTVIINLQHKSDCNHQSTQSDCNHQSATQIRL